MKHSILLAVSTTAVTNAFVTPSSTSSLTQQQRQQHEQRTTRLNLLEPIESTTLLTSVVDGGSVVDTLGSLALLGSVGFGVFMGKSNNPDWSYEYKPGNDGSKLMDGGGDLALLEESPGSVLEKVEEDSKPSVTSAQQTFFGTTSTSTPAPSPPKATTTTATSAATTPAQQTFFNKGPSKELLESTEKAKAQVQKVGVQETKDKMSSKTSSESTTSTPAPAPVKVASTSTEVAETKKSGGKRRIAKGVALIVAAAGVAAARNVIKAYLGRGML